ncbi:hypothetical protein Gotur_008143, partial [Gossypium turneri]
MEQIRSLEVPNIGIEDLNQSYQNIGIDINDPTVPDEGSNQQNIVAEWSDLYNLCRFINQQLAAGAEIEFPNLPPLDVAESSYSTDSVRKRSAMERKDTEPYSGEHNKLKWQKNNSKAKQIIRLCLPIHAMNSPKLKGYGFKPSDQILIDYLRDRTLFGRDYLVQDIIDLGHDICNYDPWDLP